MQPPIFEVGHRGHQPQRLASPTAGPLRHRPAQKDFAVFEDGIRQELSLFTHENLPISLVLLIDTSASMDEKLPVARAAATRFVKTLRPRTSRR